MQGSGVAVPAADGESSSAAVVVRMHPTLLYITPRKYEQAFWDQFQHLDLLVNMMTPLVMMFYILIFRSDLQPPIYCVVLFMKGYQLLILLLPTARQVKAHAKLRLPILVAERVLRQLVVPCVFGTSIRYRQWIVASAASNSPTFFAAKLLLLVSGIAVAYPMTFFNPVDIISQFCLNTVFLVILILPNVAQVACATSMLVRAHPVLVWCQWLLELVGSALASCTWAQLQWAMQDRSHVRPTAAFSPSGSSGGSSSTWTPLRGNVSGAADLRAAAHAAAPISICSSSGSSGRIHTGIVVCLGGLSGMRQGMFQTAFAAVAVPAGPAPDLDSAAGRLNLALAVFWMLYVMWYLPLYTCWRLERRWKICFLRELGPEQRLQQQPQQGGLSIQRQLSSQQQTSLLAPVFSGGCTGSSAVSPLNTCPSSSASGTQQMPEWQRVASVLNGRSFAAAAGAADMQLTFWLQLLKHLCLAALGCFAASEVFVLLCVRSPALAGLLWPPAVL